MGLHMGWGPQPGPSPGLLWLPAGTSVLQVLASDADDPSYGSSARVAYSVLEGEQHFTVDSKTGKGQRGPRRKGREGFPGRSSRDPGCVRACVVPMPGQLCSQAPLGQTGWFWF